MWKEERSTYIEALQRGHIKIIDEVDEMMWNFNKEGGSYTTKLGYIFGLEWDPSINKSRWKSFWKVNAPLKAKLHVWLILNNKALNWDQFQKRSFQGPSMCPPL